MRAIDNPQPTSAFATAIRQLTDYVKDNYSAESAHYSVLTLKAFLLNEANIENSSKVIQLKLGEKTERSFDKFLYNQFISLTPVYFADRESNFEILKDEIFSLELFHNNKKDQDKNIFSPGQELSIKIEKQLLFYNDSNPHLTDQDIQQRILLYVNILSEFNEDDNNLENGAIKDEFIRIYIIAHFRLAQLYKTQLDRLEPYSSTVLQGRTNLTPQQTALEYSILRIDILKKAYSILKRSLHLWIKRPSINIGDVQIHTAYSPSYLRDQLNKDYDSILIEYNQLIKTPNHDPSYKDQRDQFKNDHGLFLKYFDEKNMNKIDYETEKINLTKDLDIYIKQFSLQEALKHLLPKEKHATLLRTKLPLILTAHRKIIEAMEAYYSTSDHYQLLPPQYINNLEQFYSSFLKEMSLLKKDISLGKELLNKPQFNFVLLNLITIIGINKTDKIKSKKELDPKSKLIYFNKLKFLEILCDFLRLCFHFGKISFDIKDQPQVKQFYAAHEIALSDDLTTLFCLLEEDISTIREKIGKQDQKYSNVSAEEIALAEDKYNQLIEECVNEAKEDKYHEDIENSIQKNASTEEYSEHSLKITLEEKPSHLQFFTPVRPEEEELYFKASKIEIKAADAFAKNKLGNYTEAAKIYTQELEEAIQCYNLAKVAAYLAANHFFVVSCAQEIANCYLRSAICQPVKNISQALKMYKNASHKAQEALHYFNEFIIELKDDNPVIKMEDLFKGIHIIMNSVTEAIAESERYLKKLGSKLTEELRQETELLVHIIDAIGPQNWYKKNSHGKISQYAIARRQKRSQLKNSEEILNSLNNLVHKEPVIETSLSYRALFNDQTPYPLEHLLQPQEENRYLTLKAALTEEPTFGDKLLKLKNIENDLLLLGGPGSEDKPSTMPLLKH